MLQKAIVVVLTILCSGLEMGVLQAYAQRRLTKQEIEARYFRHEAYAFFYEKNTYAIGVFGGFEAHWDYYSVLTDKLLTEGYDPGTLHQINPIFGLSLKIPISHGKSADFHSALLSVSLHQSDFEIMASAVKVPVRDGMGGTPQEIDEQYVGEFEHKHIAIELAWKWRKYRSRWWFRFASSMQYNSSFTRFEQLRTDNQSQPMDPAADRFRFESSDRFDVNTEGDVASLGQEFQEITSLSFGLLGAVAYNFSVGRFEYGPQLELAYSLTNIDGKHADWRRLSARISLQFSCKLGELTGHELVILHY